MRLLEASGHEVEREYYVNDAGTQVRLFAESIAARMRGAEPPEDGYAGEYVAELAERARGRGRRPGRPRARSSGCGIEAMRTRIQATLERFGVRFDTWSSERELRESGAVERALDELRGARPHLRERGRALAADDRRSATTRTGS